VPRLYLVRHGLAAAGWGADADPGLDPVGEQQAAATAAELRPLGPVPVVTSPLRRCRETAEPLLAGWGVDPIVEPRVGEIPSPSDDLAERSAWLAQVLPGTWAELGDPWRQWRKELLDRLGVIEVDTVVVTHFVAVNVVIGAALGDDRLVIRRPAHASITVVVQEGGHLHLLAEPEESGTEVL
jgi:broad specificity phosphatase PhoE